MTNSFDGDCFEIHEYIIELIIGEKSLNKWKLDLKIINYCNLNKIVVKKNSLRFLNSLKICNCEKLKTFRIEDGDRQKRDGAFLNVGSVTLESIIN